MYLHLHIKRTASGEDLRLTAKVGQSKLTEEDLVFGLAAPSRAREARPMLQCHGVPPPFAGQQENIRLVASRLLLLSFATAYYC